MIVSANSATGLREGPAEARRRGHRARGAILAIAAIAASLVTAAASGTTAAPLWGYPTLMNSQAAPAEVGWSVSGTRAYLWRRDPPAAQPTTVEWPRNPARRKMWKHAHAPQAALWRRERPLATVTFDAACTTPLRTLTRLFVVRVPLSDPSLLRDGPVTMRFTYHLEQRQGWADALVVATANEATEMAEPGGAETAGELRLWLDPVVVREARGVSARVRLTVRSRACGRAVFALDSVELNQS